MSSFLADTNVLLRWADSNSPDQPLMASAIVGLRERGHVVFVAPQNLMEFWAVGTRPSTSRGGFGWSQSEALKRLEDIERFFPILLEPRGIYGMWRHLIVSHGVLGVAVHDARLVAVMQSCGVDRVLTLNGADFRRYLWIAVVDPQEVQQLPWP